MTSSCTNMIRKLSSYSAQRNGAGGRSPAPWGRGRSGWAATGGCAGRWPGCGACPRLGFAARGRCGPSPGVLRGRAVADAGGARVEGATIDTAWRRGTASRSRSLFLARRRRRVRQQGASRGFWAKCSEQDVAPHANPPSADGERQSLYFAHAMCTDRDLVAGVARARLPYAANMVSGVDAAWVCAWRGAGSRGGSGGASWHTL